MSASYLNVSAQGLFELSSGGSAQNAYKPGHELLGLSF
jgi:hypothetical protein